MPWLGIQWLSQGGVTVQVVNCAVLPRAHPIGMLLLFVSILLQCPSFYCFLAARADARGKPISNPNATISHNFRRAAFGIFLLLLKGNRAAGTHCLLMAAPAGYNDAECYYVSACCYRHYDIWGITTPGQGINRHRASELSSILECIHWWPCCRGLAFNGCRRGE